MPWFRQFGWFWLHWHLAYLSSFADWQLVSDLLQSRCTVAPTKSQQVMAHHLQMQRPDENISTLHSSSAGIPSTGNLEFRILASLDEQVGYAVQALRDGSEVSLAVCEALYILRVAYCHLTAHHTHKDEVEDMIEIYENHETDNYHARRNCPLQLALRMQANKTCIEVEVSLES